MTNALARSALAPAAAAPAGCGGNPCAPSIKASARFASLDVAGQASLRDVATTINNPDVALLESTFSEAGTMVIDGAVMATATAALRASSRLPTKEGANRKVKSPIPRHLGTLILAAVAATTLSACGTIGDTTAVKNANELAIACQTDKALMAVDRAANGGGLGANIADLQRVVILRDAGRMSEADAAMAERDERAGADAQAAAEARRAVAESLAELRPERHRPVNRSRHGNAC